MIKFKSYKNKLFTYLFFILIANVGAVNLAVGAVTTSVRVDEKKVDINELVSMVRKSNLELNANSKIVEEKKYRVEFETSLMDPILSVEEMNIPSGISDGSVMRERKYSLSQQFPFPGKRSSLKNKLGVEAEVEKLNYDQRLLEIIRDSKIAFYEWWLAFQKREYLLEQSKVLEQLIAVIRTEYITNKVPEAELLNLQIEHANSIENIISAEAEIANRGIELERLSGGTFHAKDSSPKNFDYKPWLNLNTELENLEAKIHANYPAYQQSEKMKEVADLELEISKKSYYPDFELMAEYIPRDINSVYNLKFGISIPLWFSSKQSAAVDSSKLLQGSAELKNSSQHLNLISELRSYAIDIAEAQKRVKLYENGLNIWTTQAVSSSRAAYLIRKVSFQTLIRSIEMKYQTRFAFSESVATLGKRVAALELCLSGVNK